MTVTAEQESPLFRTTSGDGMEVLAGGVWTTIPLPAAMELRRLSGRVDEIEAVIAKARNNPPLTNTCSYLGGWEDCADHICATLVILDKKEKEKTVMSNPLAYATTALEQSLADGVSKTVVAHRTIREFLEDSIREGRPTASQCAAVLEDLGTMLGKG